MPIDTFTYDNLNRLTVVETNGVPFRIEYDKHGRILTKEQDGFSFRNASFDREHPHAVSRVEAYRRPDFGGQEVTYTPFDKVETVTVDDNSLRIEYGYDRQRIRMTEAIGGEKRVKTYIGNCEFVHQSSGGDYVLTYLCAGGGIFAVAKTTDDGCRIHYVHTDHLGSWDIITDEDGKLEQELSFDAWGNRRDAQTWQGAATDEPLFDRGFTGHEHLYAFGLINMNGRVYDPLMSMFLSPDNFIQSPDNSQNFNRYAYCMNNPLRYTDPSGEVFVIDDIIVAAAFCAIFNTAVNLINGNINNMGDFFASVAVGAVAGAAGAFVGGAVFSAMPCGGFWGGAASGGAACFTSCSITGYGNSRIQGNSIGESLKTAGIEGLKGLAIGAAFGGLTQGLNSLSYGGNFWNGIITEDYPLCGGNPVFEHPNLRNFSGYEEIMAMEDDALKTRIGMTYGSDVLNELGLNATTEAPNGFIIDAKTGVYIDEKGYEIFGRVLCNPKDGIFNMYISPYASTHYDLTMFKAVTGHELTHAYHYYFGIPVNEVSEYAAKAYSYKIYYEAGYTDMCSTIELSGYPSNYYVPASYKFSTIDFYKWYYSK